MRSFCRRMHELVHWNHLRISDSCSQNACAAFSCRTLAAANGLNWRLVARMLDIDRRWLLEPRSNRCLRLGRCFYWLLHAECFASIEFWQELLPGCTCCTLRFAICCDLQLGALERYTRRHGPLCLLSDVQLRINVHVRGLTSLGCSAFAAPSDLVRAGVAAVDSDCTLTRCSTFANSGMCCEFTPAGSSLTSRSEWSAFAHLFVDLICRSGAGARQGSAEEALSGCYFGRQMLLGSRFRLVTR